MADPGISDIDAAWTADPSTLPSWSVDSPGFLDSIWGMISSEDSKNLLNLGSGLYGLYEADKMKDLAKDAYHDSDPFGPYRGQYAQQLMALMQDPSSITKDPGYQFQFDQGSEAVRRKMAAGGFAGSGNMGTALVEYGQNFAQNAFRDRITQLAGLAGANIAPNFSGALSGYASGIDTASEALASLGYGAVRAGGASSGTPGASRPNSAGGEAATVGKGLQIVGSGIDKLFDGQTMSNVGSGVGSVGSVVSGISKGGVQGYGQALAGAGSLAELAGYGGTATNAAKGIGSAASGNAAGASASLSGAGSTAALSTAGQYLNYAAAIYGGYQTLKNPGGKFQAAASGAATGNALFGWPGAIIGGAAGYLRAGGFKDTMPWDASGTSGITMDQAWQDQNLARLVSNPLGSLASYAGVKSNSLAGKLIDPAGGLGGGWYKEEGIRQAYYDMIKQAGGGISDTQGAVNPEQFYQAFAGEFRGNRSLFPARARGGYGKMDEDVFINDLTGRINSAYQSGTINSSDTADTIMDKVVTPWFDKDFGGWGGSDVNPEWVSGYKNLTKDLVGRYIAGSPVEWNQIKNPTAAAQLPRYAGFGQSVTPGAALPPFTIGSGGRVRLPGQAVGA